MLAICSTISPPKRIRFIFLLKVSFFRKKKVILNALHSLILLDPPKIQPNFNESIRLKRGESISIACFASGSSNLQVYWTADDSVIAINELRIETANEPFKKKNFTCVAENPFGKDFRSVFIQILGENFRFNLCGKLNFFIMKSHI